jgi:hypothetical protein
MGTFARATILFIGMAAADERKGAKSCMIRLLPCARFEAAQMCQKMKEGSPASRKYMLSLYLVFNISIIAITCVSA